MMTLTSWMQAHRNSILFLLFLTVLGGLVAAFKLPVTLFPTVTFPRVVVNVDVGDMPADQTALQVTTPIEQAVRQVPAVRDVRSTTSRGSADISINFDWGTNMALATLQVNAAIGQILSSLPNGTRLRVITMDPTQFPILAYSLVSTSHSLTELHDLATYQLRPLLLGISGVARVQIIGGELAEYQVIVNPDRLRAYHLALSDLMNAIGNTSAITAIGKMEDHYHLYLVIANNQPKNLAQLQNIVVKVNAHQIIPLSAVSTVTLGTVPQWIRVTADGQNAVLLNIYQRLGSNSVELTKKVKSALQAYSYQMPLGVKIANWYDQSQIVIASAASVRDAILIGVVLASIVLFIFLRHIKVMVIAMIVVPAVLAATILILYALNMSFNIMTLGGMAAAVGLIIDDAIVMLEQIIRRWHGIKGSHHGIVMAAAGEFVRPLAGSSAATLVIFIPLGFLSGVTGAFFKALSLTMVTGLFISFLVSWLAVPLLADRWLNEKDTRVKKNHKMIRRIRHRYIVLLVRLLRQPYLILLLILPLLILGWIAYHQVGSGFMPKMDEGGFVLDYRAPPGTSLTETDRLLRQIEAIIKSNRNVETYSRRTGTQLGGGVTEVNEGDFFIRLKSSSRQPIDVVMEDIRTQIIQNVPGIKIELAQLMEDLIGDLTAVPQPIEIKIFSDDPMQLKTLANKVTMVLEKIPGVVDINNGINPAGDAIQIQIDPLKAALEGMTPDSITQTLNTYLTGTVAAQLSTPIKVVGVKVTLPGGLHSIDTDLNYLTLQAPDGHYFPLNRVANFITIAGQPQITRENLKRMVAVTARIEGRDMGSVIRDVKKMLGRPNIQSSGVYYELGGLYQQQQIAFHGLLAVLIAAFALVFLLLLFLYESFEVAIAILSIPLLSMSAVFIGLWVTHTELNISAMMGMTMIVGIVTEVAIFYFSEYHAIIKNTPCINALIYAGWNRMRPIVMTTLTAILTLLPLALSIGTGSAMQQPLAIAIISGLIVQVPLTLLIMPTVYHTLLNMRR